MGGVDSKPLFQEVLGKLKSRPVSLKEEQIWKAFIGGPKNPEDIVHWLGSDDLRAIRNKHPRNFALLIVQLVLHLEHVLEDCRASQTGEALHMRESNASESLTCLRFLSRVMPFLLEASVPEPDETTENWVQAFLWESKLPDAAVPSEDNEIKETVTKESGSKGNLGSSASTANGVKPPSESNDPSSLAGTEAEASKPVADGGADGGDEAKAQGVGRRVVDAVMDLLFCGNFTLSYAPSSMLWASGVGGAAAQPSWPAMDALRAEVLRVLLVLCTEPLYIHPARQVTTDKPFLRELTEQSTAHARAEDLFNSLLNTVFTYQPGGWALNHGKNAASQLVDMASHALLVLLDYGQPALHTPASLAARPQDSLARRPSAAAPPNPPTREMRPSDSAAEGADTEGGSQRCNVFRELLQGLEAEGDMELVYNGLVRLLRNPVALREESVYQSKRRVDCYQEVLVLCWKLLEANPTFLEYVASLPTVAALLEPVLALIYAARSDASKIGVMHVGSFVLLLLSSRRSFGVALNQPALPANYPTLDLPRAFRGNQVDAVVHVLYKAMFNGGDRVAPLYSCLLTILANITPYIKAMTMLTAERFIMLLDYFASPKMFFASEQNYVYVKYLLESINNVVQYQSDGNAHLIYCIMRKSDVFTRLFALELPSKEPSSPKKVDSANPLVSPEASAGPPVTEQATASVEAASEQQGSATAASTSSSGPGHRSEGDLGDSGGSSGSGGAGRGQQLTEEWLARVQEELPLATLERLIKALGPSIDALYKKKQNVGETELLDYLRGTTLVGLLPLPHSIVCRKYQPNAYTDLWFTAYVWGLIYLRQQEAGGAPLADGAQVKLFKVTYVEAGGKSHTVG